MSALARVMKSFGKIIAPVVRDFRAAGRPHRKLQSST